MTRIALSATLALSLAACNPAQVEKAQTYHEKIAAACQVAMMLAPMAPPIAPWIVGGCATSASISKLALDSNSLEWVLSLIQKARSSNGPTSQGYTGTHLG